MHKQSFLNPLRKKRLLRDKGLLLVLAELSEYKNSGHLAPRPLTFLTFSLLSPSWLLKLPSLFHQAFNGAFSHDVTVAILVFQSNPLRVDFFSYPNDFFCSSKFASMLST